MVRARDEIKLHDWRLEYIQPRTLADLSFNVLQTQMSFMRRVIPIGTTFVFMVSWWMFLQKFGARRPVFPLCLPYQSLLSGQFNFLKPRKLM